MEPIVQVYKFQIRHQKFFVGPFALSGIIRCIRIQNWESTCGKEFELNLDGVSMVGRSKYGILQMKDVYVYKPQERKKLDDELKRNQNYLEENKRLYYHFYGTENRFFLEYWNDSKVYECINFSNVRNIYLVFDVSIDTSNINIETEVYNTHYTENGKTFRIFNYHMEPIRTYKIEPTPES